MKRFVFLFVFISLILFSAPYKPYPILLVHGRSGSSETWGVGLPSPGMQEKVLADIKIFKVGFAYYNPCPDTIIADSIERGSGYDKLLKYMKPYAWAWYEWEEAQGDTPTYTPDPNAPFTGSGYPNKSFLEVVNVNYPTGSVDSDPGSNAPWPLDEWPHEAQPGWGEEIAERVEEVLEEYYGEDWESNPEAKVILFDNGISSGRIKL